MTNISFSVIKMKGENWLEEKEKKKRGKMQGGGGGGDKIAYISYYQNWHKQCVAVNIYTCRKNRRGFPANVGQLVSEKWRTSWRVVM